MIIALHRIREAGGDSNAPVIGYWRGKLTAPAVVAGTVREYVLLRGTAAIYPQLWTVENGKATLREEGIDSLQTFMVTVNRATFDEVFL